MTNDPKNPEYNAKARDAIMDLCPFYDPNHKSGIVREHVFKDCLAELRERARLAEERSKRYAEREDSMRYLSSRNKELEKAGAGLVELLQSARAIAQRKGAETAWGRFDAAIEKAGIGSVTPRTFRILGDDDPEILGHNDINPATGSDALVPPLRLIDLDSPWLFGIGRDMTDEERENAEKHGRHDNPPMSVLGVTHEGLAAVDGKELAQLFVAAPKMLAALQQLETGLMNEEENGLWDADYMLDQIIRPALREASGLTLGL